MTRNGQKRHGKTNGDNREEESTAPIDIVFRKRSSSRWALESASDGHEEPRTIDRAGGALVSDLGNNAGHFGDHAARHKPVGAAGAKRTAFMLRCGSKAVRL